MVNVEMVAALSKAIADVQHLSTEEAFIQCVRPYVLDLVEEISMRQDSDIEALETIEHAVNEMFMGGRKKVAA